MTNRFLITKYDSGEILISLRQTFTYFYVSTFRTFMQSKRNISKNTLHVPLLLLLRYFLVPEKTQPPLAKTILIPAHSTLPFSHNCRARMRFALTFAITLTWSRHRSYREKWRYSISALTTFSRFSGRSRFTATFLSFGSLCKTVTCNFCALCLSMTSSEPQYIDNLQDHFKKIKYT